MTDKTLQTVKEALEAVYTVLKLNSSISETTNKTLEAIMEQALAELNSYIEARDSEEMVGFKYKIGQEVYILRGLNIIPYEIEAMKINGCSVQYTSDDCDDEEEWYQTHWAYEEELYPTKEACEAAIKAMEGGE